jgi:allantoin racemase
VKRIGILLPTSGYGAGEIERRRGLFGAYLPPDFEIEFLVPADSPEFLDEAGHFDEAIGAAGALLRTLSPDRFAAIIFAGALDPGLAAAREASPVPVVGPGEASMYLAWLVGRRISIVTVDEHAVAAAHRMLDALALVPPLASIRSMEMPVRAIMSNLDAAEERLHLECARAVEDDGAEALFLGAMILGMLPTSDSLAKELGVPVINPVRVSASAAAELAHLAG